MNEHPTAVELLSFLDGSLTKSRFRELTRHLLRGCPACQAVLAPQHELMVRLPLAESEVQVGADYDRALDRAMKRIRSHSRVLHREPVREGMIARLLEDGGGMKALVDKADLALQGLSTLKSLLERAWLIRHEDPREMACLARAAVKVAQNLDPRPFKPEALADLQAWAWGELGNALRVGDDLDEAERAFGIAFDHFNEGTRDPYLKARLYDLHASFLGTRRQFDLAFAALEVVDSTYVELGESHLAGKALLLKAIYTHYSGRTEEALEINQRGMARIHQDLDPNLTFSAVHNQLTFLVACGRFREAKKSLFRHRSDLQIITGRVSVLKLRWLEAQISAALEEWESAERILTEVKVGFDEEGMGFAAAIASLDLALLWMRQGRHSEAKDLALETVEVFVALRVRREALGAMMILREAFKTKTATVRLLEEVVEFLRQSEIDPSARFLRS